MEVRWHFSILIEDSMMEFVVSALMSVTNDVAWRKVGLFNPPATINNSAVLSTLQLLTSVPAHTLGSTWKRERDADPNAEFEVGNVACSPSLRVETYRGVKQVDRGAQSSRGGGYASMTKFVPRRKARKKYWIPNRSR